LTSVTGHSKLITQTQISDNDSLCLYIYPRVADNLLHFAIALCNATKAVNATNLQNDPSTFTDCFTLNNPHPLMAQRTSLSISNIILYLSLRYSNFSFLSKITYSNLEIPLSGRIFGFELCPSRARRVFGFHRKNLQIINNWNVNAKWCRSKKEKEVNCRGLSEEVAICLIVLEIVSLREGANQAVF
jgi:hypothetical protein